MLMQNGSTILFTEIYLHTFAIFEKIYPTLNLK